MWLLLACAHPSRPPAPTTPPAALEQLLALGAAQGDTSWQVLARFTDDVGPRPTGSAGYEAAVDWTVAELQRNGTAVREEPVDQPAWHRGAERLQMVAPRPRELALLGLGGTVGTDGPLEAEVVVVHRFEELGPAVAGKIVLYNVPMEGGEPTIQRYGPAVAYRSRGASEAAKHGAVAALVRSVTTRSLYTPHTGGMRYEDGVPRIPTAAITTEDADQIDRLTARGIPVRLRLELGAQLGPETRSSQVVGEIRGAVHPEQVVLLGAHLDSWDVGQGAHDDGAGVVEVIEALRLLGALDTPPARTVRGVLYANEEWGLSGGRAYAAAHGAEPHVVAMETDLGGGAPRAWSASGTPQQLDWLRRVMGPLGLPVEEGGGGADISTLEPYGVLLVGLRPDDRHYFDVHHTHADTVDKVDPVALREATTAVAAFAWLAANAPEGPPPGPRTAPEE